MSERPGLRSSSQVGSPAISFTTPEQNDFGAFDNIFQCTFTTQNFLSCSSYCQNFIRSFYDIYLSIMAHEVGPITKLRCPTVKSLDLLRSLFITYMNNNTYSYNKCALGMIT